MKAGIRIPSRLAAVYGLCLVVLLLSCWRYRAKRIEAFGVARVPAEAVTRGALALVQGRGASWEIVEFMDYQCPPCRSLEIGAAQFRKTHPAIRWTVRQFPLPMHTRAEPLARIAYVAQDFRRFPRLHGDLFQWQDRDFTDIEARASAELDMSVRELRRREAAQWISETLLQCKRDAIRCGVTGTPSMFAISSQGVVYRVRSLKVLDQLLRS